MLTEKVQRFRVSGRGMLEDYLASPEGVRVQVQLRPSGSVQPIRTEEVTLHATGGYVLHEVEPGNYDLAFKASH